MEVTSILSQGSHYDQPIKQWQPGERLLVEVINKNGEHEGTIRVNGQVLSAVLETSTQLGDKFWVQVGDVKDGFLMLLRETQVDILEENPVNSEQFKELTERGLPLKQNLAYLIKDFSESESSIFDHIQSVMSDELFTRLRKYFPDWESLSDNNGAETILDCLRKLGINYEHRLQQMTKLDSGAKELEKESLRGTLKYAILDEINQQTEENRDNSKGTLAMILDKLTGQQLWYKTGMLNNGFALLHLPILNHDQVIPIKVGIEGARKGLKMDDQHCRVAIQLETEGLGSIGIDAYFNENSLRMNVLSSDVSIPELVEGVLPETKARFAKLGFILENVGSEDLDHNNEFRNFLKGIRRSGVDIEG
jgi:hypothetical protein